MKISKRIISGLLAISTIFSFVIVSASASGYTSTSTYIYDSDSVSAWRTWIELNLTAPSGVDVEVLCFNVIDKAVNQSGRGAVSSLARLQAKAGYWNESIRSNSLATSLYSIFKGSIGDLPTAHVVFDPNLGVYRLREYYSGLWVVDSSGLFPYYCEESTEDIEASTRQDQWLPFTTATSKKQVSVLTKDSLSNLCVTLNQTDRTCSVRDTLINDQSFYVIIDTRNNIYANADGVPYVANYDPGTTNTTINNDNSSTDNSTTNNYYDYSTTDNSVTNNKYDYIINEGDTINEGDEIYNDYSTIIEGSTTNYEIVDNSQVIDLSNGEFTYIGKQSMETFNINELIYDFSTQSYSADTYNYTYNSDDDTYNFVDYTWNVTYNITNVYVTNIGQTELYEPLELYYVLPDGRSSADLTAEEVAGMSFKFYDCVNYAKSATDTYLRALYHFDGNTDDSSYFSTQGKFEWVSGASIEYMDVGTFSGALYLGPESHSFKITLPSNIGSGDFTLQFRYYQAGSADTQSNIENTLSIGGTTILKWDEGSLYNGSGTSLTSLAIGTWQELAVMRHSGTLYLYHNGISIGSSANTSIWNSEISLVLGSTTRAYSMIDELRVINFAAVQNGSAYTCTSVPYDTNAVLVLPDSAFPIADEYWEIKSSYDNILTQYGLDDWTGGNSLSSYFQSVNLNTGVQKSTNGSSPDGCTWTGTQTGKLNAFPYFMYNANLFSYSSYLEGVVFNRVVTDSKLTGKYSFTSGCSAYSSKTGYPYYSSGTGRYGFYPTYGIFSPVSCSVNDYQALAAGTYTLSIVSFSGEVASVSFSVRKYSALPTNNPYSFTETSNTAFGYDFGIMCLGCSDYYGDCSGSTEFIYISPTSGTPEPIMYMELVEGATTDLSAKFINCIYSSEEVKPNTAAIQTDIPINGYTVGGVRPTFPVRGDVWMPVSNNRISGVYIYNGSAWVETNARWYTGTRWIPIYGFDLVTLEDCWDIADIDTTVVLIGSESQFWSWLQGAWQKMLDKLDAIIVALGGDPNYSPDNPSGSGGTGLWDRIQTAFSDALASIIESLMAFITDVLQLVLDLVYDLLSFFFDFLSTEVVTGIANLFSSFTDGSLLVFFQQEITSTDEDGNEVTTTVIGLPDGIATAFAFFAGVIMILPEELRNLLIFGVGALILIGILKLAKS